MQWTWNPKTEAAFFARLVRWHVMTVAEAAADIRITERQADILAKLGEHPEHIKTARRLRLETLAAFFRLVNLQAQRVQTAGAGPRRMVS